MQTFTKHKTYNLYFPKLKANISVHDRQVILHIDKSFQDTRLGTSLAKLLHNTCLEKVPRFSLPIQVHGFLHNGITMGQTGPIHSNFKFLCCRIFSKISAGGIYSSSGTNIFPQDTFRGTIIPPYFQKNSARNFQRPFF